MTKLLNFMIVMYNVLIKGHTVDFVTYFYHHTFMLIELYTLILNTQSLLSFPEYFIHEKVYLVDPISYFTNPASQSAD